ncbi:MAG: T9SS type A sorting domain-containing protein [Bacteroidetes bacterium]|nr:T9SS type A sorting domain-containing protein [Bacteroidota bacterium]
MYPNPSSTVCIIKNKQGKKELYNVLGELIFSTKEDEIDVRHLSKGMCYLRCENEVKKVIIE